MLCTRCIQPFKEFRAMAFLEFYKLGKYLTVHGPEKAMEKAREIRTESGRYFAGRLAGTGQAFSSWQKWMNYLGMFPESKCARGETNTLICNIENCLFKNFLREYKLGKQELSDICSLFCKEQDAMKEIFPDAAVECGDNALLQGDSCCEWIMTLNE